MSTAPAAPAIPLSYLAQLQLQPKLAPLGQVATRASVPGYFSSSYKQSMTRTMHFARQTLTQIQVAFPNFYVTAGISGEAAPGASCSVTASVEYPAGTFTQLKFSGSATGTIANGSYLMSDVAVVSIPNGAQFWVRFWNSCSTGVVYKAYSVSFPSCDATAFSATTTPDLTLGGTVTATGALSAQGPCAIVAPTTLPAIGIFGDSKAQGLDDYVYDSQYNLGQIAKSIGTQMPYIEFTRGSDTAIQTVTNMTNRAALGLYCSALICQLGFNDLFINNATISSIIAARTAIYANFSTLKCFGCTLTPHTTSTDNWATLANQALVTTNSFESQRLNMNNNVRAGIPGELSYFDLCFAVDPQNTGYWPTNGTAFYYTKDGTHETTAGNILIKSAHLFSDTDFSRR